MTTLIKTISLKELLKQHKARSKMTWDEIGVAADVPDVKKGQGVYFAATDACQNINYRLADYVLNQTFGAVRPRERVFTALDMLGLPREQTLPLKGIIDQFIAANERTAPPVAEPAQSSAPHALAKELEQARDELARARNLLLGEDPARPALLAVSKRLDRIAEALSPQSTPAPKAPGSAAASTNAARAASS